tara:strand:+ start:113 stop:646 length:534 start_codon:yes stop_codon:yes gene_type:complete
MKWALCFLLSCVVEHNFSYENFYVNQNLEAFMVGKPRKKADWAEPPRVRICADTEVSIFRMEHALQYWKILGYNFGNIRIDSSPLCMNIRDGEILVTLPEAGFGGGQMASTRLYTHIRNKNIIKAKIFIMPKNARKNRVLEHEIGHAIGWRHYDQKFHIMNSNWMLGGHNSYGLHKN